MNYSEPKHAFYGVSALINKIMKMLGIGYVPLFNQPGMPTIELEASTAKEIVEDIAEKIRAHQKAFIISSCLWLKRDDTVAPCFLMDKAEEIAEHIKFWSENHPEYWFNVNILKKGDRYAITLFPSPHKSAKRLSFNYAMSTGKKLLPEDIQIMCSPLCFVSRKKNSIFDTLELPTDKIYVGFLDKSKVDASNLDSIPDPILLGPFNISNEGPIIEYSEQQLK